MELRRNGIWSAAFATAEDGEVAEVAAELEELGYGSVWLPTFGPGAFERVELLLRQLPCLGREPSEYLRPGCGMRGGRG